jgi:carbon-monoxide dehydrogenase medium subunit
MTIAHDFAYLRPGSLAEATAMLAEFGPEARVLAGGTDLVPWLRDDAVHPTALIDLKAIDGLGAITERDDAIHIGALVTFTDLLVSGLVADRVPVVAEAAATVASVGIRNRATLVGNLCSAVPSCDGGPALLVYDAVVAVTGPGGTRSVPIADWFRGPRQTSLEAGEIVAGVSIPLPGVHGACYAKLSRYRGEDLSQAGVAVAVFPGPRYRVAFGAVGPVPFRAAPVESLLDGRAPDEAAVENAVALVEDVISPITDVRSSKEYRSHMCRVMLRRALAAAEARMRGEGPPYGEQVV